MKAYVNYWYEDLSQQTGYEKNQEVQEEEIPKVVMHIFSLGLNVLLHHNKNLNCNIIWVDDKIFRQR